MNRVTAFVLVATSVAIGSFMTGCGADNSSNADLKGVTFRKPDKIEGYSNVDGHPNLIRLCIDGQAFLTNSRTQNSVLKVPEWNSWCPTRTAK